MRANVMSPPLTVRNIGARRATIRFIRMSVGWMVGVVSFMPSGCDCYRRTLSDRYGDKFVLCVAAGIDDGLVGCEDPVGEVIVSKKFPDVFDTISSGG
jgi:hypothetical protein